MHISIKQIINLLFSLLLVLFFVIFLIKVVYCISYDNKDRIIDYFKNITHSVGFHHIFHQQDKNIVVIRDDEIS